MDVPAVTARFSCALSVLGLALWAGCARQAARAIAPQPAVAVGETRDQSTRSSVLSTRHSAPSTPSAHAAANRTVSTPVEQASPAVPCADDPFAGYSELPMPLVVDAVLTRNPSLAAMVAAWRAAAQRYAQVVALDDPMFSGSFAPESLGSNQVEPGYMLEGSQKFPWPGKRRLRGRAANAEAGAAWHESAEMRLAIIEAAQTAFYDYYLAWRLLQLNARDTQLARESQETAQIRYSTNLALQQDVLSAELEVLELQRRNLQLRRMQWVAVARINTLLHRPPDFPLPPPAQPLDDGDLPPPELLRATALEQRPDLAMFQARIRAEEAQLALAYKEYYPDAELYYRYDAYWQPRESDLRSQVGMNVNVPLNQHRRAAAVREALWRLRQRRAEFEQGVADAMNEVQSAAVRVAESQQAIQLFQRSLPLADQAAETARAGYISGGADFLRLLEAQRRRLLIQERHAEAVVEYHRRLAELERAVGGPIPRLAGPEELPLAP